MFSFVFCRIVNRFADCWKYIMVVSIQPKSGIHKYNVSHQASQIYGSYNILSIMGLIIFSITVYPSAVGCTPSLV